MIEVLFMGRKQVSAKLLRYCFSLPNVIIKAVLTDSHLKGSPTTIVARELGLPTLEFDEALSQMKNGLLSFDLGISILYWRKLKEEFLTIPSRGVINFHPALLPEYKGTGGYNLAILDSLSEWGVSAHYVDDEIDTGNIIKIDKFNIDLEKETVVSLESKSMTVLENMVQNVFSQALSLTEKLPSEPNVGGRYVSRAEMESMKKIELGDDIERKVRAFWFPPYVGAYIEFEGKKYTLVSQEILHGLALTGITSLFAENSE